MSAKPKAAKQQQQKTVNKTFQVAVWDGSEEGEKIIVYADSGMGKTTLASMLPTPVFIGLDDGGRKIKNPITGESLKYIPDIETFADFRTAVQQQDLFNDYETLVVDTGTILEPLALAWTIENIKTSKSETAKSIEHYGYGAGHRHLYDTMRLPLADFDALIRRGKNVCILCQMQQVEIANSGGENYLCDAPKLAPKHGKQTPSIWGMWVEWADHLFKISNEGVIAAKDSDKAKIAKATSTGNRIIHVHAPEVHYKAKCRERIPPRFPVVSFDNPADDSIWRFLLDECWRDIPVEGGK